MKTKRGYAVKQPNGVYDVTEVRTAHEEMSAIAAGHEVFDYYEVTGGGGGGVGQCIPGLVPALQGCGGGGSTP